MSLPIDRTGRIRPGRRPSARPLGRAFPLAPACLGIALLAGGAPGCGRKGSASGFQMPPTPVEIAPASLGRVEDRFHAVGTAEADEAVTVVAETEGTVRALPFEEGAPIRRGEVLANIDDTEAAAGVARAEALRDQARLRFDRVKGIVARNAAAPEELDNAEADLRVAEANLAYQQALLAKTRARAPFDGVVGRRRVSPGAYLRKGDVIAEIAAVDHVKIRFDAPERYLGDLRRGATVTVRTPVDPLYEREGTIEVVNPILDEATRSAQVVARIPNRDHRLRPGQSVDVSAVLSVRESAITIPDEAIFAEGDRSYVFVAKDDGTVARVAVETGARLADRVEIRSGLAAGSRVVTAGHQKLFDGAKVVPVGPGPPAGAGPAQGGPEPAAAGAPE